MSKTTIPSGGLGGGLPSSLTVGSAAAEDTKVVFDGNAQDYHIGLDDSADDLVIGKGSALGTTAHIVTDENGHVTMPLQSFVYASLSSDQTITANDSDAKVTLDQELYDVNGDFNTSTNTFTAPVSGVYMVTAAWQFVEDLNSNITDVAMKLNASNGDEFVKFENPQALQVGSGSEYKYYANGSKIIYMDANDTMYLEIDAYSGGSHTFKLNGGANQRAETSMQVYLLG